MYRDTMNGVDTSEDEFHEITSTEDEEIQHVIGRKCASLTRTLNGQ